MNVSLNSPHNINITLSQQLHAAELFSHWKWIWTFFFSYFLFWVCSSIFILTGSVSVQLDSDLVLQLQVWVSYEHRLKVFICVFHAEPAPPRSLYAVNATHSSVTLLWSEEGVVDYYQVLCKPNKASKELKVSSRSSVSCSYHQSCNKLFVRQLSRVKCSSRASHIFHKNIQQIKEFKHLHWSLIFMFLLFHNNLASRLLCVNCWCI